jgi:hypothetical protein
MAAMGGIVPAASCTPWENMMDFLFIGLIVGFFALSAGLIAFCARLMGKGGRS